MTGSPGPGVLRRLRPARAFGWHRAYPPPPSRQEDGGGAETGGFRVHCHPVSGSAPGSAPAASPRLRRSPSPWPPIPGFQDRTGVSRPVMRGRVRAAYQPVSTGFRAGPPSRGVTTPVPRVRPPASLTAPGPSGSAGPPRLCRGCSPPSPPIHGSGCPQLHPAAATARRWRSLTSIRK